MHAIAKHPALCHTDIFSVADVTKYLEFKAVDGSFVLSKNVVQKVPATDMEAIRSPLMGLLEKNRARKFFS
jgi:Rab GDP dissociation inhibitor